jgi:hypothetical protein
MYQNRLANDNARDVVKSDQTLRTVVVIPKKFVCLPYLYIDRLANKTHVSITVDSGLINMTHNCFHTMPDVSREDGQNQFIRLKVWVPTLA